MATISTLDIIVRPDGLHVFAEDDYRAGTLSPADTLALAERITEHRDQLQDSADRARTGDAFRQLAGALGAGLPVSRNVHASEFDSRVDVELRTPEDVQAWAEHFEQTVEDEQRAYGKPATRRAFTTDCGLHVSSPWLVAEIEPVGATP